MEFDKQKRQQRYAQKPAESKQRRAARTLKRVKKSKKPQPYEAKT
ncbi:hypothetical protein BpJC7_15790 [Weizmannia acidilactici]|uniref:Uncharacterized protein n=1 Tax=Weizmannia acidilactici TaxID=2607726 RepID=A0A5J4J5Q5_9BACI|nr:hypothetical protein BpJC4_23020 [Weizmannia acidilactici]GER70276.1 hypothetical protein BpJC7_15790 [Weizmannia acidilactici]